MIISVIAAGVASCAFGVMFNIRGLNILISGINGALGFFLFSMSVHLGIESYIAMFFASLFMSMFAEVTARFRKAPALLFFVAALIPIVPGGGIFQFVLYLLEGRGEEAVQTGIRTLMETSGIAIGVIIVSSIIKMIPFKNQFRNKKS